MDTAGLFSLGKFRRKHSGEENDACAGGTFRDVMRDTDEATRLEREAKAVKSEDDADTLIADMLRKVQAEP